MRGLVKLTASRQTPEADLQAHVASMLRAYLPAEVWWTASLSGLRLSPRMISQAKRAGMNRGAPDLSFIFPDGSTRYIELKASEGGGATREQKALKGVLRDDMVFCRSWREVRATLAAWLAAAGLRFLTDTESVRAGRAA